MTLVSPIVGQFFHILPVCLFVHITRKYDMLPSFFIDFIDIFSFVNLLSVIYFLCERKKGNSYNHCYAKKEHPLIGGIIMNEATKQMRVFCQKCLVNLNSKNLDEERTIKTIIAMLDQMHKRLALLEGVDLRELDQ